MKIYTKGDLTTQLGILTSLTAIFVVLLKANESNGADGLATEFENQYQYLTGIIYKDVWDMSRNTLKDPTGFRGEIASAKAEFDAVSAKLQKLLNTNVEEYQENPILISLLRIVDQLIDKAEAVSMMISNNQYTQPFRGYDNQPLGGLDWTRLTR